MPEPEITPGSCVEVRAPPQVCLQPVQPKRKLYFGSPPMLCPLTEPCFPRVVNIPLKMEAPVAEAPPPESTPSPPEPGVEPSPPVEEPPKPAAVLTPQGPPGGPTLAQVEPPRAESEKPKPLQSLTEPVEEEEEEEEDEEHECELCKITCSTLGDKEFCKERMEKLSAGELEAETVNEEFSEHYGDDWQDRVLEALKQEGEKDASD